MKGKIRMLKEKIAFIGAGNMAEAIIGGVLGSGLTEKNNIIANDIKKERLDYLGNKFGIKTAIDTKNSVLKANIIVLSVKPQNIKEVLKGIKDVLKGKMVISIAAGITTETIEKETGAIPVIRVMPNTPALVRKGMAAISKGKYASYMEEEIALKIFQSVGEAVKVEEKYMDIVTAISGSGPGYIFYVMEAMIEAGIRHGLPRDTAKTLVFQTMSGSAELAIKSGKEPEELRRSVCSPGGTTLAILKVLEDNNFFETMIKSIDAGSKRSKELSRG